MRATHQIVLATAAQVLAEVATLVAVAALVAAIRALARLADPPVAPRVVLMVRAPARVQIALVETVLHRIVRVVTATGPILRALRATVIRAHRAPVESVPIPPDLPVMVMHGHVATAIRVHHGALVTDLTRRAHLEMVIHVHVVMASAPILHVRLAMATGLVARRAQAVTAPIPRALPEMATDHILRDHRATARARIAPMAIARAPIVRGMTVPAQTVPAQTGRAPIALTATSPAATGSPMAESVVPSARR